MPWARERVPGLAADQTGGRPSRTVAPLTYLQGNSMPEEETSKNRLLGQLADEAAPAYRNLYSRGILLLSGEDCDEFGILFPKRCFAHLCGFELFRDASHRIPDRQELFLNGLLKGDLPRSRVDYSGSHTRRPQSFEVRRRHARQKTGIARMVFDRLASDQLDDGTMYAVDSAKSSVKIFIGEQEWSIGLGLQLNSKSEKTGLYIPVSMVKSNVLSKENAKAGGRISVITHAEHKLI